MPEGCKLLRLTTRPDATVSVDYKPKPRVRVLNESFAVSDYPVRGLKARGIRLSPREIKSCKFQ